MRVFADTNFLVSALATRGLSADVFELILAEHQLVTGEFVLDELKRVWSDKFEVPGRIIEEVEQLLRRYEVVPLPEQPCAVEIKDKDDRWVLESARHADVEVFITGDSELLALEEKVVGFKILTPRGFWELLKK